MVCFELWINGQRQFAAGIRNGHLHGHMHCGYWNRTTDQTTALQSFVSFSGTDPDTGDNLHWNMCPLQVGDEMVVRLVEQEAPDLPNRRPRNSVELEAMDRKMYERLKAKFETGVSTD